MVFLCHKFAMPRTTAEPKFTKGEKCIFIHLLVTFIIILILFIIYAIHVYTVKHTQYGIFSTRRSLSELKRTSHFESLLVGYLYLNMTGLKIVCNTLLLKPRWSICTAHCISVHSDPEMAQFLLAWGLKYNFLTAGSEIAIFATTLKRSIAHPLFNRETFANNIGLLEHATSYPFEVPDSLPPGANHKNGYIVGWNHSDTESTDIHSIKTFIIGVNDVNVKNCSDTLSPITAVRNYEFCVTLQEKHQMFLDYGAVVFADSKVRGIFSWGERYQEEIPMVIINITLFQSWLNTIV